MLKLRHRLRAPVRVSVVALALIGLVSVRPASAQDVDSKRAEAREIAARLAELQEAQMTLSATYERANYERHLAEQKVAAAQAEADETQRTLEQSRLALREFAVAAYQGSNDGPVGVALMTASAASGVVKRHYLEATSGNRGDLVDSLRSAQQQADEDVETLEAARADAEAHVRSINEARDRAADAAAEQQELNARVQGELADLVALEAARNVAEESTVAGAVAPSIPVPANSNAPTTPSAELPAPAPSPQSPPDSVDPPPSVGSGAQGAISAAMSRLGSPYVWGAAGPNAFDCSGLILWAYARVGVSLPHYSGAQYSGSTRITAAQLQPGDLVFWGPGGSEHVALYMGGNQLVHAFPSGGGVRVTALAGWWKTPTGYGRLNY